MYSRQLWPELDIKHSTVLDIKQNQMSWPITRYVLNESWVCIVTEHSTAWMNSNSADKKLRKKYWVCTELCWEKYILHWEKLDFPTVFPTVYVLLQLLLKLFCQLTQRLFSSIGLPLFLVFFERWLRQIIVSDALVDLVIDIWVVNILHSWESPSTTTTQPVQTWPFHRRKLKWRHSSATCTLIQINENEQLNYYRILDYMVLYKYIFIWLPIKSITYN